MVNRHFDVAVHSPRPLDKIDANDEPHSQPQEVIGAPTFSSIARTSYQAREGLSLPEGVWFTEVHGHAPSPGCITMHKQDILGRPGIRLSGAGFQQPLQGRSCAGWSLRLKPKLGKETAYRHVIGVKA
jgi:hypothetical protein